MKLSSGHQGLMLFHISDVSMLDLNHCIINKSLDKLNDRLWRRSFELCVLKQKHI